ncbi:unnamed protein product [Moneuplotes crassus]|uniref:Uncharacterized protein n=1 Tax=Euplotes crassus TaxID=5936 RepID=A0AAD1UM19_EUPCR|nr:unnamed protein product [Moneuplotes crassus]
MDLKKKHFKESQVSTQEIATSTEVFKIMKLKHCPSLMELFYLNNCLISLLPKPSFKDLKRINVPMPSGKTVSITNISQRQLQSKRIFEKLPKNVGKTCFNSIFNTYSSNSKLVNISRFMPDLASKILPRATSVFMINGWKLQKKTFQRLIHAAYHLDSLWFDECAIFSEGFKITPNRKFNIKVIGFGNCGASLFSNWENHPERFEEIIKGISESPNIKRYLKTIRVTLASISRKQVHDILQKYNPGGKITF